MTAQTAVPTKHAEADAAPAGTAVERKGWVLMALMSLLIFVFGLQAFFAQDPANTPISGSGCCNGERLSTVSPWVYDYANELTQYLGTYMIGTGLFALTVAVTGLRRHQRWAWAVSCYIPMLFAIHGFVLGSFPFDIPTLALSTLGLMLLVRPVFRRRRRATS
jgi:uncharacterized membrane protein HdeD (DUF308 family)